MVIACSKHSLVSISRESFTKTSNLGIVVSLPFLPLLQDTNQIQKHGYSEKLLPKGVITNQQNPSVYSKSISPDKLKKNQGAKFSSFKEAAISGSNHVIESKMVKKKVVNKVKAYDDIVRCNSLTSQGADVSSITSTKDMTSTRTPSVERFRDRQPLPSKGRKALINLAQEAMQNPNIGALKAPTFNRKRVATSPGITNRKLIYPTPTPLHFSGTTISGAGALNNRGDAKPIKDGPCVGTKGFRAPEVLMKMLKNIMSRINIRCFNDMGERIMS